MVALRLLAILSYCWGKTPQLPTIKSNLATHSHGIAPDGISRTVRDAITVAKLLGFSRLWVDAGTWVFANRRQLNYTLVP